MVYTNLEKLDMIECYIICNKNSKEAAERYFLLYFDRPQPSLDTFKNLYNNLKEYGSFVKPRNKGNIGENTQINVLAAVNQNPSTSTRQIAQGAATSQRTVVRILSKHKYHPYKKLVGQTLHPGDDERRLNFCAWFVNMCHENNNFPMQILWTDETRFTNCGMFNRHNEHLWAQINPHRLEERRPQIRFGFNLWCGVIGSQLVGPFIFNETLTGNRYLQFLREDFDNILDELNLQTRTNLRWFQHDGAPPHYQAQVKRYLDELLPNSWIGRNGPVLWPARSPDLSPLDFFVFGAIKDLVYVRSYATQEELLEAVINVFDSLDGRKIRRAINSVLKRCRMCVDNNGRHFEHLM